MNTAFLMIMSWQFWALLHGVIMLIAVGYALHLRKPFTALLSGSGLLVGAAMAVLPLWILMRLTAARTGFDSGNMGIFFCCTVPFLPLLGLFLGGAMGSNIDNANEKSRIGKCHRCGFDISHSVSNVCPECGENIQDDMT